MTERRGPKLVTLPKGGITYRYKFTVVGVPYRDNTGKTTESEAYAFALALKREAEARALLGQGAPKQGKPTDQKLKLVIADFWEHHARFKDNAEEDRAVFGRLMDWLGAETMMSEIDKHRVMAMRSMLTDKLIPTKNNPTRKYQPAAINAYLRQLRRIHTYARTTLNLEIGLIAWKTLFLIEGKQRTREITEEDLELMCQDGSGYAEALRFAVLSGFRLGNFSELRWSEIDRRRGMIELTDTKVNQNAYSIPITSDIDAILRAQQGHHPEFVFTYVCRSSRMNPKTKRRQNRGERYPIAYEGFKSWFDRRAKEHQLPIRIHDTRRAAGGRILEATGDISLVQAGLNLSSNGIARKHYAHTRKPKLAAAMEAAAQLAKLNRQNADKTAAA